MATHPLNTLLIKLRSLLIIRTLASKQESVLFLCLSELQTLLEHYFALHDKWVVGTRQAQKIVKKVANKAQITQESITSHLASHLCNSCFAKRLITSCCTKNTWP